MEEFIIAMLIYTSTAPGAGMMPPAVIQGFASQPVCEAAAFELRKQEVILKTTCVKLPANRHALERGRSIDGSMFKKVD